MTEIAFDPSPDHRWLFLFAHPDDEVAICAWMRRLVRLGVPVSAAWLHSTKVRRAESSAVMDLLGVSMEARVFLEFPDGGLVEQLSEVVGAVRELCSGFRPTRIATMAFEQGHLDHDSANLAANLACPGRVVEFPMYYGYWRSFMPLNEFTGTHETLVLGDEERRLKSAVLKMYPSQTIRRNVFCYGLLRRLCGKPILFDQREVARMQGQTNWLETGHAGKLTERIERSENWRRWVQRASELVGE